MREIKCRAWGGETTKYFVYFSILNQDEDYIISDKINEDGSRHCMNKSEIDDIQLDTGLLDKNGKEIYEGDIVRCIGFDFISTKEVKYIAPRFSPFNHDDTINMHWEIIGNIYQNEDLLTNAS